MDASHSGSRTTEATTATQDEQTTPVAPEEIVVTIRRRRLRPDWSLPRVLGWSVTAVAGDPALILVPFLCLAALLLANLGLGAPARAEVIVPALVAPPADAFQDIGVLSVSGVTGVSMWIGRVLFALGRTLIFGVLALLALQRARGRAADTGAVRATLGGRARTLVPLGALSFAWGLWVSQQSSIDPARDATIAATALAFGMLFLPGAFVAAVDGAGLWRAIGRGFGAGRPAGHVLLVLGYGGAINGLYRLAVFGEPSRGRTLALTLYAFAAAFTTTVFVCALARRIVLRRDVERPEPV